MKMSKNYEIHYYHCSPNLICSVYSMIRFFEDIAIQQSESLGIGVEYYHREKVGWMLTRWLVDFTRLPKYGETIKIITTPKAFSGFYANREYVVEDSEGNEILKANTLWIFVNLVTRRPARITQVMHDKYAPSEREMQTFTKLEELKSPEKTDHRKQFRIRMSDMDTNGHTNNSHYISWALETLPAEIHSDFKIQQLSVNYLKETSINEIVIVNSEVKDQSGQMSCSSEIICGDIPVARIESNWIKK